LEHIRVRETAIRNGEVSFWHASSRRPAVSRRPLPGQTEADVCIVGAGYTGLWTAYYLKKAAPALRVVVLEKEFAGFGASGRNGGWLSGTLPGFRARYAAFGGRQAVEEWQHHLQLAIDDVINVCHEEHIDADVVKGGCLRVATTPAQYQRLGAMLTDERSWGLGDDDVVALSRDELVQRIRVAGALGGLYTPHCARIHPIKLAYGLADAVERLGVEIYEQTSVLSIAPNQAATAVGDVRAKWVVRATEGFTAGLPGLRRTWLPMNSSMIVTDPISEDIWQEIGWGNSETLADLAHAYAYLQRTADDRIALGGRGVPYRFGSSIDDRGATDTRTMGLLVEALNRLFPVTRDIGLAHAWCGVIGVARDWCASVGLDRSTGAGWAGGYIGNGVTTANLAGQTLADLVLGEDTPRTRLPWVGHQSRRWEPEPLRWLGVRSLYVLYRAADRMESRGGPATSPLAKLADLLSGRRQRAEPHR
jgi:glycine/D-amino acid oxidase-like deaminating enzyme